jgi:PHP family Zn ribbon phosphoesterase
MAVFRADLHIHSCLSPCGDLSSSPRAVAHAAKRAGLDLAALTDHNTARNAPAFETACRNEGITPLFGIEVTTWEEVHALVIFPSASTAWNAGEEIYERLSSESFDAESFGDQVWVNEHEEIEGTLDKLLILGATDLSLDDLGPWCRQRGGLFIPAHIDRMAFGLLGQLGFLPDGPFDGVECTKPLPAETTGPWTVTASSDAHYPDHIGRRHLEFSGSAPSFDDLFHALGAGDVRPVF